jgi:protein SCO1/2
MRPRWQRHARRRLPLRLGRRDDQYAHPTGIVVATPQGRIARYLYGVEYAPKDLRFAVVEASSGRVGSPGGPAAALLLRVRPGARALRRGILRTVRFLGI